MYGPVKATYWPYVEGFFASNSFAYSSGTGALIGSDSAWTITCAIATFGGSSISIRSVLSSGAVTPAMSGAPPVGLSAASFAASS